MTLWMCSVWVQLLAGPIEWNRPSVTIWSIFQNPVTHYTLLCHINIQCIQSCTTVNSAISGDLTATECWHLFHSNSTITRKELAKTILIGTIQLEYILLIIFHKEGRCLLAVLHYCIGIQWANSLAKLPASPDSSCYAVPQAVHVEVEASNNDRVPNCNIVKYHQLWGWCSTCHTMWGMENHYQPVMWSSNVVILTPLSTA